MENFQATIVEMKNENEEIKKIFDGQSSFLRGLILFSVLQYIVLLAVI